MTQNILKIIKGEKRFKHTNKNPFRNKHRTWDGPSRTLTLPLTTIVLRCKFWAISFRSHSVLFILFRWTVIATGPSELSFRIYNRQENYDI